MKARIRKRLRNCKRRIQHRLRKQQWQEQRRRLFRDRNIHYEVGDKTQGLPGGGLELAHRLLQQLRFADTLDDRLHLLKRHLPYFESDHVSNMTYNLRAGGQNLEDIELLRNNETYLNILGAQRLPDPTTAGDFLRRFQPSHIATLMQVINEKRLLIWQPQPPAFFAQGILEADGTLVATTGEGKAGIDIAYEGTCGYHPLVVSLANTQEPLFLCHRPARRPSHEGAAGYFDQAITLCRQAGFRKVSLRGDTDFSQTQHLDRWTANEVRFVFGIDAMPNLVAQAKALPATAWQTLPRPAPYEVATTPRQRPDNIKQQVVRQKGYQNLRLVSEQVAEFSYRPGSCEQDYRIVVLRKQMAVEKGGEQVGEEIRYFFYITNERDWSLAEVVYFANDRCNPENLIEQLKNGVHALRAPVKTREANGAYMVIGALAWTVKVWLALLQPRTETRHALLTMEFKAFLQQLMLLPCQIVRGGRCLIYRLLVWNPWVKVMCESVEVVRKLRPT